MASHEIDSPPPQVKALAAFLIRRHSHQLRSIALSPDPKLHYPLYVDFAELMDDDPPLAQSVFSQPTEHLRFFDDAAVWAHRIVLGDLKGCQSGIEKKFIHVRINVSGSPLECPETFPSIGSVRVKHRGILLTLKGTVIRSGAIKMYEGERWYICQKCNHSALTLSVVSLGFLLRAVARGGVARWVSLSKRRGAALSAMECWVVSCGAV
ncbi:hypothetical protein SLA2020_352040 [Shorea laevis]